MLSIRNSGVKAAVIPHEAILLSTPSIVLTSLKTRPNSCRTDTRNWATSSQLTWGYVFKSTIRLKPLAIHIKVTNNAIYSEELDNYKCKIKLK